MNTTTKTITDFQLNIFENLNKPQKSISSIYFYDEAGSKLFEDIMTLDEYYLTRCETNVFEKYASEMARVFSHNSKRFFNLVELGAGDGVKTKILLNQLIGQECRFLYSPIDISSEALRELDETMRDTLKPKQLNLMEGDYFKMLHQIGQMNHGPKVILFLGSSIGNYSTQEAIEFLRQLEHVMSPDDRLMVGFDMVKESNIILDAYNDKSGVTAKFNYNLLHRMNRELGANFKVDQFEHCPIYDPVQQAAKSYLVSKKDQEVYFELFDDTIHFAEWESIYTESSYKYTEARIQKIAQQAGFAVDSWFYDEKKWIADVLLRPASLG